MLGRVLRLYIQNKGYMTFTKRCVCSIKLQRIHIEHMKILQIKHRIMLIDTSERQPSVVKVEGYIPNQQIY